MRKEQGSDVGTQVFIGPTRPDPERFDEPTNRDDLSIKPAGGLWTSTLRDDGGCAWLDWCRANDWGPADDDHIYVLEPEPNARVIVIDGVDDMRSAQDTFARVDLHPAISRSFAALDYEEIAETYDAVHVTDQGQRETRFSRPGLYGWDCESTVWLRWAFESVVDRGPVAEAVEL